MSIREQLEPHIRAMGINQAAARSGIAASVISEWLAGKTPNGCKRPRRLADNQLESLAAVVGHDLRLTECQSSTKEG